MTLLILCGFAHASDLELRESEYYVLVQTNPKEAGRMFGTNSGNFFYKMHFGEDALEFTVLEGKNRKFKSRVDKYGAPEVFSIKYHTLANTIKVVYPNPLWEPTSRILLIGKIAKDKLRPEELIAERADQYMDGDEERVEGDWVEVLLTDQTNDFFYIGRETPVRGSQSNPMGEFLLNCDVEETALIRVLYNSKAKKGKLGLRVALHEDEIYSEVFRLLKIHIQKANDPNPANSGSGDSE